MNHEQTQNGRLVMHVERRGGATTYMIGGTSADEVRALVALRVRAIREKFGLDVVAADVSISVGEALVSGWVMHREA